MAQQTINVGTNPNDGTGDPLRTGFVKTNSNFTDLYNNKQDALVSGTNIKTINGSSVLGSGDLPISLDLDGLSDVIITNPLDAENLKYDAFNDVWRNGYNINGDSNFIPRFATSGHEIVNSPLYTDGSFVGLGNSSPTTELDVSGVITATGGNSDSWNAKQEALVSGTNIKTVNSNSVLGSGDLAVQETLVSGTNIKTINGSSVLGSGNLAVKGGIHALIPLASGQVTNSVTISINPLSNTSFTANRLIAYPFIPSQDFTSSNLFINVSTLASGSFCRIAVYDDLNGYPNNRLFVSSDLDCSTTGQKTASASISFVAGTIYWLAFHGGAVASSTSCILPAQSIPLRANTIGSMANCIFYNLNFTTPTPATFLAGQSAQSTNLQYIGITKA